MQIAVSLAFGVGGLGEAGQAVVATPTSNAHVATVSDFPRDNLVFDSGYLRGPDKSDRNSATLPLSGALSDATGGAITENVTIEARALLSAGGQTPWQVAGTANIGATNWTGSIALPRSASEYRLQVRVMNSSEIDTMGTDCAVGHVLNLIGQSEHQRIGDAGQQTSPGSKLTYPTVSKDGRVRIAWRPNVESDPVVWTSVSNATPHSPAVAAMANALIEMRPDDHITVIFQTKGATNLQQLANDENLDRSWSEDLDIINVATGNQITGFGAVLLDWTAGPGKWGEDYDQAFGRFFTKRLPDGTPMAAGDQYSNGTKSVTYDHYWADLDPDVPVLPFGPHRFETVSSQTTQGQQTVFRNAERNADGSPIGPMMLKRMVRKGMKQLVNYDPNRFWPKGASPLLYRNGDVGSSPSWNDIAHPGKIDGNQGLPLWAQQNAYVFGQMMGWQTWVPPEITADDVTWDPNGGFVDIAIGQTLSTVALLEGGSDPSVAGFEVSGRAATAEINEGTVRVYHPDGAFSANDSLRFGMGGASGVITYVDDIAAEIWKQWPMVPMTFTAAYDGIGSTNPGIALEPVVDFDVFSNPLGLPGGTTTVVSADTKFIDNANPDTPLASWSGVDSKLTLQIRFTPEADFATGYQNIISYGSLDPVSLSVNGGDGRIRTRARDGSDAGVIDTNAHTLTFGETVTLTFAVDFSDPANGKAWLRDETGTLLWSAGGLANTGGLNRAVFRLFEGTYTGSFEHAVFWTDCTADGTAPSLASAYRVIAGAAGLLNAHEWREGPNVV